MKVKFLSIANQELIEAKEYYDKQYRGLGGEFILEVELAIQRIIEFPKAWKRITIKTRRCKIRRFPYGVAYQVRKKEIIIFGIINLKRNPSRWEGRF